MQAVPAPKATGPRPMLLPVEVSRCLKCLTSSRPGQEVDGKGWGGAGDRRPDLSLWRPAGERMIKQTPWRLPFAVHESPGPQSLRGPNFVQEDPAMSAEWTGSREGAVKQGTVLGGFAGAAPGGAGSSAKPSVPMGADPVETAMLQSTARMLPSQNRNSSASSRSRAARLRRPLPGSAFNSRLSRSRMRLFRKAPVEATHPQIGVQRIIGTATCRLPSTTGDGG